MIALALLILAAAVLLLGAPTGLTALIVLPAVLWAPGLGFACALRGDRPGSGLQRVLDAGWIGAALTWLDVALIREAGVGEADRAWALFGLAAGWTVLGLLLGRRTTARPPTPRRELIGAGAVVIAVFGLLLWRQADIGRPLDAYWFHPTADEEGHPTLPIGAGTGWAEVLPIGWPEAGALALVPGAGPTTLRAEEAAAGRILVVARGPEGATLRIGEQAATIRRDVAESEEEGPVRRYLDRGAVALAVEVDLPAGGSLPIETTAAAPAPPAPLTSIICTMRSETAGRVSCCATLEAISKLFARCRRPARFTARTSCCFAQAAWIMRITALSSSFTSRESEATSARSAASSWPAASAASTPRISRDAASMAAEKGAEPPSTSPSPSPHPRCMRHSSATRYAESKAAPSLPGSSGSASGSASSIGGGCVTGGARAAPRTKTAKSAGCGEAPSGPAGAPAGGAEGATATGQKNASEPPAAPRTRRFEGFTPPCFAARAPESHSGAHSHPMDAWRPSRVPCELCASGMPLEAKPSHCSSPRGPSGSGAVATVRGRPPMPDTANSLTAMACKGCVGGAR